MVARETAMVAMETAMPEVVKVMVAMATAMASVAEMAIATAAATAATTVANSNEGGPQITINNRVLE